MNLAHLSLADALARRGEMSLRVALGAGTGRLLRGLAVEPAARRRGRRAQPQAAAVVLTPRVITLDADLRAPRGPARFDCGSPCSRSPYTSLRGPLAGVLPAFGRVREAAPAAGSRR